LDALEDGFDTHLIPGGTRPTEAQAGDAGRALGAMRAAGALSIHNDAKSSETEHPFDGERAFH